MSYRDPTERSGLGVLPMGRTFMRELRERRVAFCFLRALRKSKNKCGLTEFPERQPNSLFPSNCPFQRPHSSPQTRGKASKVLQPRRLPYRKVNVSLQKPWASMFQTAFSSLTRSNFTAALSASPRLENIETTCLKSGKPQEIERMPHQPSKKRKAGFFFFFLEERKHLPTPLPRKRLDA